MELAKIRASKVQTLRRETASPTELELLDFIPAVSPRYERPDHLAQIAELFERALNESVRALVSVPPQFAKTETILHGVARNLGRKPWLRNAYASYGSRLSTKKSRQCRDIAIAAGVTLRDDAQAVSDWQTTDGGGLVATGIRLPLTGSPVDGILVIDDPHKDRADAESALARERVFEWYTSTAEARVHPGASVIVCHTRWNEDDLIGRLSKLVDEKGKPVWQVINLPAILPDGTTLWHQRPIAFLEQRRRSVGEYDWWSQYMGSPRPRGSSVFRGTRFYDELPVRYRIGKGVDLASTAKTRADWSAGVVLVREDRPGEDPLFYVVDVRRKQCEVPTFAAELEAVDASWPGSWHWFCSTTERGTAQLLTARGVYVDAELATADKFVRAGPIAAAWNAGRVLVPRKAPWLKAFVDEIGAFTGVGDRHDDQVDALASAFEIVGQARVHIPKPKPIAGSGYRWANQGRGF